MDQFFQIMLYSKMFENMSPILSVFMICTYIIPHILPYLRNIYCNYLYSTDECSMQIPYHKRNYATGGLKTTKIHYSPLFMAINHYMKNNSMKTIQSFIEILNFEKGCWFDDSKSEYILLPNQQTRILVCNKNMIYLEIIIESEVHTEDDKKESSQNIFHRNRPNFIFKLVKAGRENIDVLNEFVNSCKSAYEKEITQIKDQMIYEYIHSYKDEDGNVSMKFDCAKFKSNKTFDNLFFEGKQQVIEDIRKFSKSSKEKDAIISHYKRIGRPYKQTYLLYGPPGTGKSSLIKAFANETGRHCTLIQWSRIKTAEDFTRLCHQMKVDSNHISQGDNILVFEDFDANRSTTVKARENLSKAPTTEIQQVLDLINKDTVKTADLISIKEDELTLECVLNTLDGIKELYDAVVVFTTNDIGSLDPALIRAGRIDRKLEMKLASTPVIKDMLCHYYQIPPDSSELACLNEFAGSLAPAKIQELCDTYSDITECIRHIKDSASE